MGDRALLASEVWWTPVEKLPVRMVETWNGRHLLMQNWRYLRTAGHIIRDMEISISDVYGYCPLSGPDCCFDRLSNLHSELWCHEMPVESWKIYHRSLLKKSRAGLLGTGSMAPFFSRLSMAFCRYSVLFLVKNCLSVLVRGGNESHSNRTPDLRILDDLHSPWRFCQACANPARWAPTGFSSLPAGTLRRSSLLFRCERLSPLLVEISGRRTCCLAAAVGEVLVLLVLLAILKGRSLPSWLTGGPNLWCTNNLEVPAALGAGFSGTLKCVVRPLWRECLCCMVKIFASNCLMLGPKRFLPWNGTVLTLAT